MLVLNWNKKALELKHEGKIAESLLLFLRAEELLRTFPSVKLQFLTYNNLACHFEKEKSYHRAVSYLNMCTKLKVKDASCKILYIGVFLNLSAIKSKLNLHEAALNHSLKALSLLETIQNSCLKTICYYSIALEYEFLLQMPFAKHNFKQAFDISVEFFGSTHEITDKIRTSLRNCQEKANNSIDPLCILREKTSQPKGRTKRKAASRDITKYGLDIRVDTTPWQELVNWRAKTQSETPKLKTSRDLRQKFSQLSQETNRSAVITGKLEEKLNYISKKLASLNGKLNHIEGIFEGDKKVVGKDKIKDKISAAVKIQRAFREYIKRRHIKIEKSRQLTESKNYKVIPFFLMNFDVPPPSNNMPAYKNAVQIRKVEKNVQTSRGGPRMKKVKFRGLLESIVFIQKCIRGFLQRRRYKRFFIVNLYIQS